MAPSPTEVNFEQQPPRTLLPKVSDRAEDSKHRFSKSRNGMFVFVCSLEAIFELCLPRLKTPTDSLSSQDA
jgi:hypothetical protein